MTPPETAAEKATEQDTQSSSQSQSKPREENPSYVKLAMRNMVRKGGKSLTHFFLSAVGLLGLFVGLAYLTR
ncbi:MAG: DUF3285 domain-containing protein [Cyanobacteria bacterium P01_E01_bin.6]